MMKTALSIRDFALVVEFLRNLSLETDAAALPLNMLRLLTRLVPAKYMTMTEVDPVLGQSTGHMFPADGWDIPDLMRRFQDQIHEHPVVQYAQRTRDGQAKAISDFLTVREFHQTQIYKKLFHQMGIEDQLSIGMVGGAGLFVGISFNRGRRNFSARDREILNLLRPHLLQAFLICRELQILRQREGNRRGTIVDQLPLGLINLNPQGRIDWETDTARQLLQLHYPDEADSIHGLPHTVRLWWKSVKSAKQNQAPGQLRATRPGYELRIRYCPVIDGNAVLMLQENSSSHSTVRAIDEFALTDREKQVIHCILQGSLVPQVATELSISARTVEKHLERVFQKLNVNSLAAACVKLLGS